MLKLVKGINPTGCHFQIASMGEGGVATWNHYKVLRVTGTSNNVPTIDTLVHLEYDFEHRSGNACAPLLVIPLEDFANRVAMTNPRILPVSKTDIFWK